MKAMHGVVALVWLLAACQNRAKETVATKTPKDAGAATTKSAAVTATPAPGPLDRPPYPQMATTAHGQAALEALVAASKGRAPAGATVNAGYTKLGSMEDRAEREAKDIFAGAFSTSQDDARKTEAAAGLMLSLVLDPDPKGYVERLTDAYGMSLFLGLQKVGGRPVEGARAVTVAAAGRNADGVAAARRLQESDLKDPWLRFDEGMAFWLCGMRGEALGSLDAAAALPEPPARVFVERGRMRIYFGDMAGALEDADKALSLSSASTRAKLLKGQAIALGDNAGEGVRLLEELTGDVAEPVAVDALTTLIIAEHRRGAADAVAKHGVSLGKYRGYGAEASLADGLAGALRADHARAVLALERAAKGLPAGYARAYAQRALINAVFALQPVDAPKAIALIKQYETEHGPTADSAELAAAALRLMKDEAAANDEALRAHAMDPHDAGRAAAVKRRPRAGGDKARARMQLIWRVLGGGGARAAARLLDEAEKADRSDPYVAWARLVAQKQLDAALPPGPDPTDKAPTLAVEVVKRLGKEAPHVVFPSSARRLILDTLDEGARPLVNDSLKRFTSDPDPRIAALAADGVKRESPRPRAVEH